MYRADRTTLQIRVKVKGKQESRVGKPVKHHMNTEGVSITLTYSDVCFGVEENLLPLLEIKPRSTSL